MFISCPKYEMPDISEFKLLLKRLPTELSTETVSNLGFPLGCLRECLKKAATG
jgi:hypothetical protein